MIRTVHCEHAIGHGDDGDAECCVCSGAPCPAVSRSLTLRHREYDRTQAERWGQVHARPPTWTKVGYPTDGEVVEHGHGGAGSNVGHAHIGGDQPHGHRHRKVSASEIVDEFYAC